MMNKNVMITGANRGIGKCLVEKFAKSGCNIWACARKRNEEFEQWIDCVSDNCGVSIQAIYFDLSDVQETNNAVKEILRENKPVDILINNAGIPAGGLMTMTSMKTLRDVFDVNVFAQVQIMQLVAKKMIRQKSGSIINMCSLGGIEANPGYFAYGSSKATLIWMTKCVAKELAPFGIRVNGIAPGLVDTEMGNYKSEEELKKTISRTAMKRLGKPDEIANTALFLASEDSSFVTGQIIVVDGGRM